MDTSPFYRQETGPREAKALLEVPREEKQNWDRASSLSPGLATALKGSLKGWKVAKGQCLLVEGEGRRQNL